MTYCLGWLTKHGSYLVADAAITSGQSLSTVRSSFGELHKRKQGRNVEEGALKIISAESSALTFAGDSQVGFSIAKSYQQALQVGDPAKAALERAVSSNTPFREGHTVSLMCAFYEDDYPRLMSFNRDDDLKFIDHSEGDVVQLGSLSDRSDISQLSEPYVNKIHEMGLEGRSMLASVLALCQSYGVLNYLIELGVGGTFSGGFVDSSGFHWQPDIGYLLIGATKGDLISRADAVFTIVREDVLSVRSVLADGPPRLFATNTKMESIDTILQRGHRADAQNLELLRAQKFEYLAFLNHSLPIVAMIEMGRNLEHRSVVLYPIAADVDDGLLPCSISPNLSAILSGSPEILEPMQPGEDYSLRLMFYFESYLHPHFDIEHVGFRIDFFCENVEEPTLPEETLDIYNAAKDTAEIFIQNRGRESFSAANLLTWFLNKQGKKLESFIPEEAKLTEGNVFDLYFPIYFTKNSFHMLTTQGRLDIKRLELMVKFTWLPADDNRPGDTSIAT